VSDEQGIDAPIATQWECFWTHSALGSEPATSPGQWRTVVGIVNDVVMPGGRAADFYRYQMYLSPSDDEPSGSADSPRAE
jgi:hypothetical protein